jgi:hypothetical protein
MKLVLQSRLVLTRAVRLVASTVALIAVHAKLWWVVFRRDGGYCCKPTKQDGKQSNDDFAPHAPSFLRIDLMEGAPAELGNNIPTE